jgi:hypothetical protein
MGFYKGKRAHNQEGILVDLGRKEEEEELYGSEENEEG